MYLVRTLGVLDVSSDDGTSVASVLAQPKRAALLCYLAAARPGAWHTRDHLTALFWPERDHDRARNALNQAVFFLRRSLGTDALLSRADELMVNRERVRCDVVDLDSALKRGALERAIDLYGGEFLDGFHVSDAPEFDHWLDRERTRWRDHVARAAADLSRRREAARDHDAAIEYARRACTVAPYDDQAASRLVTLLIHAGQPARALKEYETFAERLLLDLELEPTTELRALAAEIRASAGTSETVASSNNNSDGPVVDREVYRTADSGAGRVDLSGGRVESNERGITRTHTNESEPTQGPSAVRAAAATGEGSGQPPEEPVLLDVGDAALRRQRVRRVGFGLGSLLAVFGLAGITTWLVSPRRALEPHGVIVAVFENETGDSALEPLGRMAADWITDGLQRSGLQTVPTLNAIRVSEFVRARMKAGLVRDPVTALAKESGSGLVVSGRFYLVGDSIEYNAQVTDAAAARLLIAPLRVRAPIAAPMQALDPLKNRITGGVAFALGLSARLGAAAAAYQPPTYASYLEEVAGWERFLAMDFRGALVHLRRAAAFDPSNTRPLLMAGIAHGNLGEFAQADSLARIVAANRERLSPFQQLTLDHLQAYVRHDWAASLRANEQQAELAPESQAPYIMAFVSLTLNRPRSAIELLNRMDPERGSMRGWSPYWEVLTSAYHLVGDHKNELRAVRRARRQYPDQQNVLDMEIRARVALGHLDRLPQLLQERRRLQPVAPRFSGRDRILSTSELGIALVLSDELRAHGHSPEANPVWSDEPQMIPKVQASEPDERAALGRLLYANKRWADARALFQTLASEDPANIEYQGYLGATAARLNDRHEAARIIREFENTHRPYLHGGNFAWCARIATSLGNDSDAVHFLRLAFRDGLPFGIWLHQDLDLSSLRDNAEFQELTRTTG